MNRFRLQPPRARRSPSLDSPEVSFRALKRTLAVALVAALPLVLAGCQEDRSNLLPEDSTERIESEISKIRTQVGEGLCFEALRAAKNIEEEINALGPAIDPNLLTTLRDGVTQLQIKIQDECDPAVADEVLEPVEEVEQVEEVVPPSGATTPAPDGEGGQGGDGQQPQPEPAPEPTPTPTPTPTPPPDNSGGVSPSASGGASVG